MQDILLQATIRAVHTIGFKSWMPCVMQYFQFRSSWLSCTSPATHNTFSMFGKRQLSSIWAHCLLWFQFTRTSAHCSREPIYPHQSHSTVKKDEENMSKDEKKRKLDEALFFEGISRSDGCEGFLGILYTAFSRYPLPQAADTYKIFPYIVPAEALARSSVMRVQFEALEELSKSDFFGPLTDDNPLLPPLLRTHLFAFRPLNAVWHHVVHRCWRRGCPREHRLGTMRRCSGCERAFYCSKDCQRMCVA